MTPTDRGVGNSRHLNRNLPHPPAYNPTPAGPLSPGHGQLTIPATPSSSGITTTAGPPHPPTPGGYQHPQSWPLPPPTRTTSAPRPPTTWNPAHLHQPFPPWPESWPLPEPDDIAADYLLINGQLIRLARTLANYVIVNGRLWTRPQTNHHRTPDPGPTTRTAPVPPQAATQARPVNGDQAADLPPQPEGTASSTEAFRENSDSRLDAASQGPAGSPEGRPDDSGKAALEMVVRAQFGLEQRLDELQQRQAQLEEELGAEQQAIEDHAAQTRALLQARLAEQRGHTEDIRKGNAARARIKQQQIEAHFHAEMAQITAGYVAEIKRIEKAAQEGVGKTSPEFRQLPSWHAPAATPAEAGTQTKPLGELSDAEKGDPKEATRGTDATLQTKLDLIDAEHQAAVQQANDQFEEAMRAIGLTSEEIAELTPAVGHPVPNPPVTEPEAEPLPPGVRPVPGSAPPPAHKPGHVRRRRPGPAAPPQRTIFFTDLKGGKRRPTGTPAVPQPAASLLTAPSAPPPQAISQSQGPGDGPDLLAGARDQLRAYQDGAHEIKQAARTVGGLFGPGRPGPTPDQLLAAIDAVERARQAGLVPGLLPASTVYPYLTPRPWHSQLDAIAVHLRDHLDGKTPPDRAVLDAAAQYLADAARQAAGTVAKTQHELAFLQKMVAAGAPVNPHTGSVLAQPAIQPPGKAEPPGLSFVPQIASWFLDSAVAVQIPGQDAAARLDEANEALLRQLLDPGLAVIHAASAPFQIALMVKRVPYSEAMMIRMPRAALVDGQTQQVSLWPRVIHAKLPDGAEGWFVALENIKEERTFTHLTFPHAVRGGIDLPGGLLGISGMIRVQYTDKTTVEMNHHHAKAVTGVVREPGGSLRRLSGYLPASLIEQSIKRAAGWDLAWGFDFVSGPVDVSVGGKEKFRRKIDRNTGQSVRDPATGKPVYEFNNLVGLAINQDFGLALPGQHPGLEVPLPHGGSIYLSYNPQKDGKFAVEVWPIFYYENGLPAVRDRKAKLPLAPLDDVLQWLLQHAPREIPPSAAEADAAAPQFPSEGRPLPMTRAPGHRGQLLDPVLSGMTVERLQLNVLRNNVRQALKQLPKGTPAIAANSSGYTGSILRSFGLLRSAASKGRIDIDRVRFERIGELAVLADNIADAMTRPVMAEGDSDAPTVLETMKTQLQALLEEMDRLLNAASQSPPPALSGATPSGPNRGTQSAPNPTGRIDPPDVHAHFGRPQRGEPPQETIDKVYAAIGTARRLLSPVAGEAPSREDFAAFATELDQLRDTLDSRYYRFFESLADDFRYRAEEVLSLQDELAFKAILASKLEKAQKALPEKRTGGAQPGNTHQAAGASSPDLTGWADGSQPGGLSPFTIDHVRYLVRRAELGVSEKLEEQLLILAGKLDALTEEPAAATPSLHGDFIRSLAADIRKLAELGELDPEEDIFAAIRRKLNAAEAMAKKDAAGRVQKPSASTAIVASLRGTAEEIAIALGLGDDAWTGPVVGVAGKIRTLAGQLANGLASVPEDDDSVFAHDLAGELLDIATLAERGEEDSVLRQVLRRALARFSNLGRPLPTTAKASARNPEFRWIHEGLGQLARRFRDGRPGGPQPGGPPRPESNATVSALEEAGLFQPESRLSAWKGPALAQLSDRNLLAEVFTPRDGAYITVQLEKTPQGWRQTVVDGSHRVAELLKRAGLPASGIAPDTPVYIRYLSKTPPVSYVPGGPRAWRVMVTGLPLQSATVRVPLPPAWAGKLGPVDPYPGIPDLGPLGPGALVQAEGVDPSAVTREDTPEFQALWHALWDLHMKTGRKYAVVELLDSTFEIVQGGKYGFLLDSDSPRLRIWMHTHPHWQPAGGPSPEEVRYLGMMPPGQQWAFLIEPGFHPYRYSVYDALAGSRYLADIRTLMAVIGNLIAGRGVEDPVPIRELIDVHGPQAGLSPELAEALDPRAALSLGMIDALARRAAALPGGDIMRSILIERLGDLYRDILYGGEQWPVADTLGGMLEVLRRLHDQVAAQVTGTPP